jgi:hypothetical protein
MVALLGLLTSGCAAAPPVATSPAAASAEPSSDQSSSETWTGPVRPGSTTAVEVGRDEAGDAARPEIDLEQVGVDSPGQPHWRLQLAAAPPKATTLDPTRTVISYGLTFETTGDGVPDYVVGISNEASPAGDFRVWVTELATGDTEEQIGPPYGIPVEFIHPDESGTAAMMFTFLPGGAPGGIDVETMFYAWASVEEDGEVVAWDYAPEVGWLSPTAQLDTTAPIPANEVGPLAAYPECQSEAFDFVGRGTLRALGLHTVTPVPPPDIDRAAMIWVTHDLMPHDFGPPGGPVEMTRMLCFEFADGSGGSGWPVDSTWRPP